MLYYICVFVLICLVSVATGIELAVIIISLIGG
jgi:hypothetical protein